MITNVENVVDWLRINDLNHWTVKRASGTNDHIFKTNEDETLEDRILRFRKIMDLSQGGRFIIEAKQDKDAKKGFFREEFSNLPNSNPNPNTVSGFSGIPEGYVNRLDMENAIASALEKERAKNELERLKEENRDLKKEIKELDTPVRDMLRRGAPILSGLFDKYASRAFPSVAIAGHPGNVEMPDNLNNENTEIELEDKEYEKLIYLLNTWKELDPDYLILLEKIVAMCKNSDPMYNAAKSMLG